MNTVALTAEPSVLVIDDDPDMRAYLCHLIEPWATPIPASSGEEALQLARMAGPDLVLLDVNMPGLDGFDVINELQHDTTLRHVPVIFITGEASPEIESECLESGATDYVSKPVNPRVLLARARTQLLLKRQSDELSALAEIDGTTGAASRRALDARLSAEHGRARRAQSSLSLLLVDVAGLSSYNDIYGHLAGDAVLRQVADIMQATARRATDVVARFDGGTLAMLLPDTTSVVARSLGDRVREEVAMLAIPLRSAQEGMVTVTVGVSDLHGGESAGALVAAAERHLRDVKLHATAEQRQTATAL